MTTTRQPTSLVDWIDDLTVRFLLNLPASELSSVPRLCFQVEEAQWFYEDFVRPAVAAAGHLPLPSLPLRQFCLLLFQHCPLLSGFTDAQHIAAYEEFLAYKVRVPVRGAIMLDQEMENVVLVRGWKKGASWSFPRGKINKDEKDLNCAVREVYEETGFDAREAGVVPEEEDTVKSIDITMREQHMKLFVFRGVSKETHFEPRTRKEIGGIKWYAIKDLPGFKKQKFNHEGDGPNASKFYMVAPFLAQLKKWIGQQRRNDASTSAKSAHVNGGAAQLVTEDEGDEEEVLVPETAGPIEGNTGDLRRLLSSQQPPQAQIAVHESEAARAPAIDLLAMLRGPAGQATTTQISPRRPTNPLIPTWDTVPPDFHGQAFLPQQQRHPTQPHFSLAPQRPAQHDQRHASTPGSTSFDPCQNGQMQNRSPSLASAMPPHSQQQYLNQRHNMAERPLNMSHGWQGGFAGNGQPDPNFRGQLHISQTPAQNMHFPSQPRPDAYMVQGPQGAIASGPPVPRASQLPPPRLNQQSMKLLDAFKHNTTMPKAPTSALTDSNKRPASTHQAALLGLFKPTPVLQTADVKPTSAQEQSFEPDPPALPAASETSVRPMKRKPTLNEITRTLPTKLKVKSPPAPTPSSPPVEPSKQPRSEREQPKSTQLFDPSAPTKVQARVMPRDIQPPPASMLQPAATRRASKSPRVQHASPVGSPARKTETHPTSANRPAASPIRILPRPGSVGRAKSPSVPLSPSHAEGLQVDSRPQVLKRSNGTETSGLAQQPDKKDQLLALFGKTATSSASRPPLPPATPASAGSQPSASGNPRNNLLDLFNQPSIPSNQPTPPPAPRIEPERRPSSQAPPQLSSTHLPPPPKQQNFLLDLFNNRTNASATPITSPGTPISPFTLGTPATATGPMQLPSVSGRSSRMASVSSRGDKESGNATPTEAKEFLMGFLNGVVKNEGHRSAAGGRR